MSRKFIAAIVASSLAITALTSTPSFAGSRDRDHVLLGIAGIVLLGAAISDSRKRKRHDTGTVAPQPVYPRPLPPRVSRYELPVHCLRHHQTRYGVKKILGRRCMDKNYHAVHRLPQQCNVRVKTRGKVRYGFSPRCLRGFGYRIGHS